MSDLIDRQKLLGVFYQERFKENTYKTNAFRNKHYEEGNLHNHGVQIINKLILIVRGMEAEDAETETD